LASSTTFGFIIYPGTAVSAKVRPVGGAEVDMQYSTTNTSGRWFRLVSDKKIYSTWSSCTNAYETNLIPSDGPGVSAFLISPGDSRCSYEFGRYGTTGDIKIKIFFAGMSFNYRPGIYSNLPSGKHEFLANFDSYMSTGQHTAARGWHGWSNVTGSIFVSGYVNLDSYIDFSVVSSTAPKITINPNEQGIKYMYAQATLRTNFDSVSTRILCDEVTSNGECALSAGGELLPIVVGLRADHSNAPSYTKKLEHNSALKLDESLGFRLNQEMDLNYLFGIDTDYLRAHPEVQGKTFVGNVSLIIESNI
jgi:hypothetical protein